MARSDDSGQSPDSRERIVEAAIDLYQKRPQAFKSMLGSLDGDRPANHQQPDSPLTDEPTV